MKRLLTLLVVLVLVAPAFAGDMQLKLAINGGYTMISNDDFNSMIDGTVEIQSLVASAMGYTADISGEQITGYIGPNIELGMKMSVFMAGIKVGIPGTLTSLMKVNLTDNVALPDMESEIEMKNWAFPIGLNLYYVLDLGEKMDLYLGAGFEYIMSKITNEEVVSKVDGVDVTLDPAVEFKGSGMTGLINIKGEYAVNDMFSLFLGLTGRLGGIKGYEGQGDEAGSILYSYDLNDDYHMWENLTPEEKTAYEADSTITNLEEATINMTGFEIYFGLCVSFGL